MKAFLRVINKTSPIQDKPRGTYLQATRDNWAAIDHKGRRCPSWAEDYLIQENVVLRTSLLEAQIELFEAYIEEMGFEPHWVN